MYCKKEKNLTGTTSICWPGVSVGISGHCCRLRSFLRKERNPCNHCIALPCSERSEGNRPLQIIFSNYEDFACSSHLALRSILPTLLPTPPLKTLLWSNLKLIAYSWAIFPFSSKPDRIIDEAKTKLFCSTYVYWQMGQAGSMLEDAGMGQ